MLNQEIRDGGKLKEKLEKRQEEKKLYRQRRRDTFKVKRRKEKINRFLINKKDIYRDQQKQTNKRVRRYEGGISCGGNYKTI